MTTRPYYADRVLLADDEPEHLGWLVDYFAAKGLTTVTALNVGQALEYADGVDFRCYVVDLNIPFGKWAPTGPKMGATYELYKGLHIAQRVRSLPNSGARVVAYSAHFNDQISAEIKKLYCRYVVKGRPRELKLELAQILRHDPRLKKATTRRSTRRPRRKSPRK